MTPALPRLQAPGAASKLNRILFVQHAGALGGSAYSLLYTMQGLRDAGYAPEVALTNPTELMEHFYFAAGFPVHAAPGIDIFAHTTGGFARLSSLPSLLQFVSQLRHWARSRRATLELVRRVRPDIVHLNSVVLLPSAQVLRASGIRHVWHVRECPPKQGWRTRFVKKELLRHQHVIFISQYDRQQWVSGKHGTVISNFVNFHTYEGAPGKTEARYLLGLPPQSPVILYFGGTTAIKGFSTLIEALPALRTDFVDLVVSMPGAAIYPSRVWSARAARTFLPLVGWGTAGQRVMTRIERLGLRETVRMLPFTQDVVPWLAACDLLVFPSVAPHFARPIIEAGAMGRPVVGSDIGGVRELVVAGQTGLLVPPGDPAALSAAISAILVDSAKGSQMGKAGREQARRRFNLKTNIAALVGIYKSSGSREYVEVR